MFATAVSDLHALKFMRFHSTSLPAPFDWTPDMPTTSAGSFLEDIVCLTETRSARSHSGRRAATKAQLPHLRRIEVTWKDSVHGRDDSLSGIAMQSGGLKFAPVDGNVNRAWADNELWIGKQEWWMEGMGDLQTRRKDKSVGRGGGPLLWG